LRRDAAERARVSAASRRFARRPVLGKPTVNVGNISGGININSVPDRAEFGIDLRILPGQDHSKHVRHWSVTRLALRRHLVVQTYDKTRRTCQAL